MQWGKWWGVIGMARLKHGPRWALCATLLAAVAMAAVLGTGRLTEQPLATLPAPTQQTGGGHPALPRQININTAPAEELTALPGIGPTRAQAIVAYREEHGPFRYPEELVQVKGIGEGILEDILDQITVGGG